MAAVVDGGRRETMKLMNGIISRDEALKVSPDYVAFVEGNFDAFDKVDAAFTGLKKKQAVITYIDGQFVRANVTSINNNTFRAVDGPVVRVSNGEYSWRVDGDRYAYPVEDCSKLGCTREGHELHINTVRVCSSENQIDSCDQQ